MRKPFMFLVQILIAFSLVSSGFASTTPGPVFTHGVASGDVTSDSAVLWVRTDQEALVKAEVSSSPDFKFLAFKETSICGK